jgi:nitrate/TMAO reductase-like tetraheme cytochrome c subunit
MSANPSFKCTQCHKFKLSDEFGTRQIASSHGQKGDRLKTCLSCTTVNSATRKRKRMEDSLNRPSKRCATPPAISPSQFVDALATYATASEIDVSSRVSLDGMTLTDKGIADHIASLAWKATGYRFM